MGGDAIKLGGGTFAGAARISREGHVLFGNRRALNARFGTAYSRNAAIGRARRMGLCRSASRPATASSSGRNGHRRAERVGGCTSRASVIVPEFLRPLPVFERVAAALQLRCVGIVPRHLSLVDLEAGDCRYPYGGDAEGEAITFCGHPRREGSSYCVSHFHLTRASRPPRRNAPPVKSGCGWWRRHERAAVAIMLARMKPLPRRHRIAHLRALLAAATGRFPSPRANWRRCCAPSWRRGPPARGRAT